MKSFFQVLLFTLLLLLGGTSSAIAASSSVPVTLSVEGCNNNGICEAGQGEDTLSCPADCQGGGGGGGGGNYFYEVHVTSDKTSATVTYKSKYPALATFRWGTTTDYSNGSIRENTYIDTHTTFLNTLREATQYYFLIEGENTNRTFLPRYTGTFTTLSPIDTTVPSPVQNFVATTNTRAVTITLTWKNPTDTDFEYVRIMRNSASGNTSPMVGQLIYEGNREYFVDTNVFIFTRYFYTIFVRNSAGTFSNAVEANAMINPLYIDPCLLNPNSCLPPPGPCTLNPSLCINPPVDPCLADPSPCVNSPDPIDPCLLNPTVCLPPEPLLPSELVPLKDTPLRIAVNTIPTIVVVIAALLSLTAIILSSSFAIGEIVLVLLRLWSLLLVALGFKKRTPPWGVVYDSITKQPLYPAYVVLLDKAGNEVVSCITDLDGRYGFVVEPGIYKIIASKTKYIFPSMKLSGIRGDELYRNLYLGTDIEVTKIGDFIASNIPLDPLHFDWNEFTKKEQHLLKFFRTRDVWIGWLSTIFFWVGALFSIYAVMVSPTGYNIAIVCVSVVLYLLRTFGLQSHPKGSISEGLTKNPLSFSILRIHDIENGREISHKVADRTGRYYAIMPNGHYTVSIDKKNTDATYTNIPISEPISVTKGYLKKDFRV